MGVTYVGAANICFDSRCLVVHENRRFLDTNLYWILAICLIAPLACVLSVEANVIVSSK